MKKNELIKIYSDLKLKVKKLYEDIEREYGEDERFYEIRSDAYNSAITDVIDLIDYRIEENK